MTFTGRMFSSFFLRVREIWILKSPVHSIKKRANYLLNPLVNRSADSFVIICTSFYCRINYILSLFISNFPLI